ncbi:MAG: DUF1565 domain-containing protein [Bacteroidia bacterium]|nr:DUF1565 domain-containing protein [Bacteroidia bacterium]
MKKLIILSIILLSASALHGQIIRIPADYPTIQQGIDAAKSGDTVLVSPGTYLENINYNGKNITVASLFLITRDTSYISRTIIDGKKTGSVVTISNGEKATAVLAGFTVTNGSSYLGGGIYCVNSSPTIGNVVITGNSVHPYYGWGTCCGNGGGIYFSNSKSNLKNVKITNNTASDANGGGIYFSGSSPVFDSINRCNVYLNTAKSGNDLYSDSPVKVVVDTFTVLKPQTYHAVPLANFTFDILHGKFAQADADVYVSPDGDNSNTGLTPDDPLKTIGQAIPRLIADSLYPRTIHLQKGRYSPSTTQEKFPLVLPDNISVQGENSKTVIVDADSTGIIFQFNNNRTSRLSGITVTGASNGGIYCDNSSPFIENVVISGNNGGGIRCENNSDPVVEKVTISKNSADFGGGIHCGYSSNPKLKNVTITNNTASQAGGGIYCDGAVPVFDKNSRCNIYLNNAPSGNDLYSYSRIEVIVDTFSVLKPQAYHAFDLSYFTFDILHGKVAQANADVYVSPDGDDSNTGLTPDDPLKTIGHVYSIIIANKQNPRTIHLLEGKYSPSTTHEKFPVILPDYISLAGVGKTTAIVDAEGTGSVFNFVGKNNTTRLSGITVTGGSYGGIELYSSNPVLENLIISGNNARTGGGISCFGSRPTLRNVTITNNTAESGGGIYSDGSVPVFDPNNRCNIYLNSAREGNDLYSMYSPIRVIVDTFTVLKPNAYHAFPLSNFTFDILHGKIEHANADVYVSPSGDNRHSGLTPEDPLKTIRHACSIILADELNPRTIHLLEGTYSPSSNNEFFPVVLPDYISLAGVNSATVILDAESTAGVFQFTNSTTSHLSGITITGGSNGGIYCDNSSPRLENLIIAGNSASYGGGILCGNNSSPTLRKVTITNNTANQFGGGMYFDGSFPVFDSINRCNIYHNAALVGNDLHSNSSTIKVIVDTFTVLHPQSWHAFPLPNFTFDIMHGKVAQADADLYISPDGDNSNSGLTPDDPLKNIRQAYPIIWADSLHPRTIHLLKGTYSSSSNDEQFPVILPDFISLAGVNDTTVILDAEGTGSVFRFDKNTSSRLSGMTITGGSNSGIYCNNSSPVIVNVSITGNSAQSYGWGDGSGGGIFGSNSSPVLENVSITKNTAFDGRGGGMYFSSSTPMLKNVTIADNTASVSGGGMYLYQSFPVFDPISRCNIYFNTAPQGNDLHSNSAVTVIVDTFTVLKPQARHSFPRNNFTFDILHGKVTQTESDVYVSSEGDDLNTGLTPDNPLKTIRQAAYILAADSLNPRTIHLLKGTYSPSATDETFPVLMPDYISLAGVNDTTVIVDAESTGSVFQFDNNTSSHLSGITITGGSNSGISLGNNSSPVIENVTITKNSGGGITCNSSSPIVKNSTISENSAGSGGGISCTSSNPVLENITLSNNTAANGGGIYTYYSGPVMKNVTLTNNSATEKGGGIYFSDSSRIAFDSISRCNIYFNRAPAGSDVYAISYTDVILDTFSVMRPVKKYAQPLLNFSFDILHGKIPQVDADVYVSTSGDNNNSGLSGNKSFRTIQYAARVIFADSLNPHTIHLEAGTYGPSFSGDSLPLVLPDYVSLNGSDKNTVRLDAGGASCVLRMEGNRSSSVSGLTVTGADSAGIYIINSATSLQNMIITNNSGTGLVCTGDNSRSLLEDVVISNNYGTYGGGMNISGVSPVFRNVAVSDNVAVYGGGAHCSTSVSDVTFSNNTARYGGAISISINAYPTKPSFNNLVIDHNVAQDGGGIYLSTSSSIKPYLKNLTCTENIALHGGGIYSTGGGGMVIYNAILWNNEPEEVYLDNSYFSAHSSDVRGGVTGIMSINNSTIRWNAGNIDTDPLFEGSGDHPYFLSAGSPCIDVGLYMSGLNLPALDILGNNRFWDGNGDGIARIDMGAYEFDPAWVGVEEQGIQRSGIIVKSYPNPFSAVTTIEYQLQESGEVSLTVYNNIGQPVAALVNEFRPQGRQQVEWNAAGLPSGIYYFRLKAGDQAVMGRILKL